MVRPVKRRQATVSLTRQLLEAVGYIRQQKQIPNLERISKYMQREYGMGFAECRRQLNSVVEDGFIMEYTAVGFKGSRTGLEQEGYKIPTADEVDVVSLSTFLTSHSSTSCKFNCAAVLKTLQLVQGMHFGFCLILGWLLTTSLQISKLVCGKSILMQFSYRLVI